MAALNLREFLHPYCLVVPLLHGMIEFAGQIQGLRTCLPNASTMTFSAITTA